jgi:hypothetical protein
MGGQSRTTDDLSEPTQAIDVDFPLAYIDPQDGVPDGHDEEWLPFSKLKRRFRFSSSRVPSGMSHR